MHFVEGQKVTVVGKDQRIVLVDIIVSITSCGDIYLSSGGVFDRHGGSKKNNFWDQLFLEEYEDGDETKVNRPVTNR